MSTHKYLLTFVCTLLMEVWLAVITYATANGFVATAAIANLTYPFVSMVTVAFFVEEKTVKGRLGIALASGFGYCIGCLVFMLFLRRYLYP